jgi:hypothetical protein
MKNSEFNQGKRGASVGMFYFYTFLIIFIILVIIGNIDIILT